MFEGARIIGRPGGAWLGAKNTGAQLGVEFSSNDAGDGPSTCHACQGETPGVAILCRSCYDANKPYPEKQCSVCHVVFRSSCKKVNLPKKGKSRFLTFIRGEAPQAVKFRQRFAEVRDVLGLPIRDGDPLCNSAGCVYKTYQAAMKRGCLARHYKNVGGATSVTTTRGRQPRGLEGPCPLPRCSNRIEDPKVRRAGAHFESWEVFFAEARGLRTWSMARFSPETAICNACYMDWYHNRGKHQRPLAARSFVGTRSYLEAATKEEDRLPILEATIAKCRDSQDDGGVRFFSRAKLLLRFRVRVLRDFLLANEPVALDHLRRILKDMIEEADPGGKELALLGNKDPTTKLRRSVDNELDTIADTVPIGRSPANIIEDGRKNPALLYPYINNMSQVGSIVANLHARVERAEMEAKQAREEAEVLRTSNNQKKTDENQTVRTAAVLLRRAVEGYAKESHSIVLDQGKGRSPLEFADPVEELKEKVPSLMVKFLNELGHPSMGDADDDDSAKAIASRKCLMAGVLTSFAFNTWYKNANVMGLFLKGQGLQREGLDFLASNFKIAQTDRYLWGMRSRLADILMTESSMKKLVPASPWLVACSFDNLNLDVIRHFGKGGHVDLIAAIAYHPVSEDRGKVPDLSHEPLRLDFIRDFGVGHAKILPKTKPL